MMKVALLGLGTVGSGVIKVLEENKDHIEKSAGKTFEVTHIFGRSFTNIHGVDLSSITLTDKIEDIYEADVDLVVEVLGGIDFPREIHENFLSRGVHVVSANKDMLALHIDELSQIANDNQASLAYEASCAGGIPIINAIKFGFNANRITKVQGILNGTTNFILTKMKEEGIDFQQALKEAQVLGYAEADPTNDVEGFDAKRKIILLSRLAYQLPIDYERVPVTGITNITSQDIDKATQEGKVIKLVGQSEVDNNNQVKISVEPVALDQDHPLATVKNEKNAVFLYGNAVGEAMLYGPGAGSLETASAVVSDMIAVAKTGFAENLVVK